jgi:predicted dehydrogenase
MLITLSYKEGTPDSRRAYWVGAAPAKKKDGCIGVAVVGAGGFAQMMHLPNLIKESATFQVRWICSRTGSTALAAAKRFGVSGATTDFSEVLRDDMTDLIIICTRHDLHAGLVLQALQAGKHVLCEKPLALKHEDLDAIEAFYAKSTSPIPLLMVGFNRRWSPAFQAVLSALKGRSSPLVAQYTMNAGYIPLEHWTHGPEGGGRNVGEACHIYDLFFALSGADCTDIQITGIPAQGRQWAKNDNFCAILKFGDGSVCTLLYTAMGPKTFPKERLQVFCEGKVIVLDDYKSVEVQGAKAPGWKGVVQDKGQASELIALAEMIRGGCPKGFIELQLAVSRATLESERRLMSRDD